jgi:hypothetical protein
MLWVLQTLGPIVILVYCHVLFHKSSYFDKQNPWLKLFISGLIGALLFSPIALGLDFLFGNEKYPEKLSSLILVWLDEFIAIAPPITLSWIAINAPWLLGLRFSTQRSEKHSEKNSEKSIKSDNSKQKNELTQSEQKEHEHHSERDVGFISLLRGSKAKDILYLQSELHYLSVVCANHKELVLYNLKDAIAELPASTGMQTHRSYWVSYENITKLLKEGRQGSVVMSNGDKVPVSRSKFDVLKTTLDKR